MMKWLSLNLTYSLEEILANQSNVWSNKLIHVLIEEPNYLL